MITMHLRRITRAKKVSCQLRATAWTYQGPQVLLNTEHNLAETRVNTHAGRSSNNHRCRQVACMPNTNASNAVKFKPAGALAVWDNASPKLPSQHLMQSGRAGTLHAATSYRCN